MAHYLDTRGLNCPLPVLKTKQALKALLPGECLEIWLDDKSSIVDLRVLFRTLKVSVLEEGETNEGCYFKVQW